jgi:hypothetical protein
LGGGFSSSPEEGGIIEFVIGGADALEEVDFGKFAGGGFDEKEDGFDVGSVAGFGGAIG